MKNILYLFVFIFVLLVSGCDQKSSGSGGSSGNTYVAPEKKVYMPYVPLEVSPTILDGNSFMPRVMLSTRYGIADNMLGADAYYGKVAVSL